MKYLVRQRQIYYEDFAVEADSPEKAIDSVNAADVDGFGPEYLETTSTYLLAEDGIFAAKVQPENADLPE